MSHLQPTTAIALPIKVSVVALTVAYGELLVLLATDHLGRVVLPSRFLEPDQALDQAALGALVDWTVALPAHLSQLWAHDPTIEENGDQSMTVGYLALVSPNYLAPSQAVWLPISEATASLPPDQARVLSSGKQVLRSYFFGTAMATVFCPPLFTVAQLRSVYEAVLGVRLEQRGFHRKVTGSQGFLQPTGQWRRGRGHPAELFQRRDHLEPQTSRPLPPLYAASA